MKYMMQKGGYWNSVVGKKISWNPDSVALKILHQMATSVFTTTVILATRCRILSATELGFQLFFPTMLFRHPSWPSLTDCEVGLTLKF